MAKNLKLKIKKDLLAKTAGLDALKAKLSGEDKKGKQTEQKSSPAEATLGADETSSRRIKAKTKSAFAKEQKPQEEEPKAVEKKERPNLLETTEKKTAPSSSNVREAAKSLESKEKPSSPEPQTKPVFSPEKLGPTGRHIKDLLPPKKPKPPAKVEKNLKKGGIKSKQAAPPPPPSPTDAAKKGVKKGRKLRDFKDVNQAKRQTLRTFDARDRQGLSENDEGRWRKKRLAKSAYRRAEKQEVIRPTELKVRLPITVKNLAVEMKLKASEIIQKLFLQGMNYTLNDSLEDETTVQYLGSEFNCEITIDTSEKERIQITSASIKEEVAAAPPEDLCTRPPVVTFMGHVDHGKTSLIDTIRNSDLTTGEAGAITQHIGAFCCHTPVGNLTILDTPGHEAFSAMRSRGAAITDIVVLVIAGDEGIRTQSLEAVQHAKEAGVTIVVAINKCDKPNFNCENVYRSLSEINLLPEAWGGSTITVNTSATTGEGIPELLEMLALQAEVLELKASNKQRARGTVLESELNKGLGDVATILVQNGTLHHGDAIVFQRHWGRVKTMHDEHGKSVKHAPSSTPIAITGLSGLPSAGDPFIVVKNEKEARSIVEKREIGREQHALQQRKRPSLESLLQKGADNRKVLKLIIRADVQGSAEALKTSILNITSEKAQGEIVFLGVGEISESDIQLASASNAIIIGFHTGIESHAEPLIKELGVKVKLFSIIYNAVSEVKKLMLGLLDEIAEEKDCGSVVVQAIFKSSHLGIIAGCLVTAGVVSRTHNLRLLRENKEIWKGKAASIKREKEDVKEVKKGLECGIVLEGYNGIQQGDVIQAYEIFYRKQEL